MWLETLYTQSLAMLQTLKSTRAMLGGHAAAVGAKGLDDDAIAAGFRAASADGEVSLEAIRKRRFSAPPADERERARQVRFLQGRGFALEDVRRFLKNQEKR